MSIDQRHKLDEEPFSYQVFKNEKVHIFWQGKMVMVLKGQDALKLTHKMAQADEKETQLILAKATGHFKHGNEKGR